jgi:hypothetical protein
MPESAKLTAATMSVLRSGGEREIRSKRPLRPALGAVGLALAVLLLHACNDTVSHIYAGRQYDPAHNCIEPTVTIDVVKGNDPGAACPAVCLVAPPAQSGDRTIYVSKECPPYPPLFDTDGPKCADALTTYAAATPCDAGPE